MNKSPIGFFDSGVGGISVLKYALSVMPEENYIYFGDSLNAPYGIKSREEVFSLTRQGTERLLSMGVKALVIACNTATSIAVEQLRREYAVPIISIEPAIKPALTKTNGNVLLLATDVTLASDRVNKLINTLDTEKRIIKVPCHLLAGKIEQLALNGTPLEPYLEQTLSPYLSCGATAAVLGCTHYPFVKKRISAILGGIPVFDGIDGTVAHLKDVLIKNGIKNNSGEKGSVLLQSSDSRFIELYKKMLYGGLL